jgi:hypothetical protein
MMQSPLMGICVMSEQPKEQPSAKQAAKLDAVSAAAALALAVTSAEKSSDKPAPALSGKTRQALSSIRLALPPNWRTYAAQAAVIAAAIGLGWAGGSLAKSGSQALQITPEWAEAASNLRQNQDDLVRLTGDVRVLKSVIESMKESVEQARMDAAAQQRSLMERVDRMERAFQDTATRIEHAGTEAGAKLAAMAGRLDGIERHVTSAKSAPAADAVAQTGSVPEPKTAPKQMPVEGWVLREVYDGAALVEARNGRLHEVVPGQKLANLGRVEAIERRGGAWVVVTSKGLIGAPTRWQ